MRKGWVLMLAAFAVVLGLGVYIHQRTSAVSGAPVAVGKGRRSSADDGLVPVSAVKVRQQDVPIYLEGLGTVQAFNTATIRSQVSGLLVEVPFKEGDEVKAGELIARVDPRSYQAALDQAIAKKAQDEAALGKDQADLKRYLDLLPDGYVSAQQVDQQRALIQQDEAQVQADRAAIESARVNLSYTRIVAPFDGVIGLRQVDVGNIVSAGDTTGIATLTQIKPIAVSFTLPEQALQQIRAATPPLEVIAVSRDNQSELARGQLIAYDSQIDTTTGTIKLKAQFDNQDKKLWPGQFVNARLRVRTARNALTVPAQAIQLGPSGSFVYVVAQDQTAEVRPVDVAQTESGVALVARGLELGEVVVVDGQSRLKPGSKVQVHETESAASPPSADGRPAAADRVSQEGGGKRWRRSGSAGEAQPRS